MKYLVTPALPYANGPLHLGHLLEHIQVSVFVRALKMAGEDVSCVCGADSHGTPIEINAQKAGKSPEVYVREWQEIQEKTLERFGVIFDAGYGSTHTALNEQHAIRIYEALVARGDIAVRDVDQLFDPQANRFLPDRFIRGECPKCSSPDQYGDSCERCGATYRPTELIRPKSVLTKETPILKTSRHFFFELGRYADLLKAWISRPGVLQPEIQNSLKLWFDEGLRDWDISRDAPYFGFQIPGEAEKYFYVWLDAPIGYVSLAESAGELSCWTHPGEDAQIIHFIGKDIVYFHTLFWPALLMGAGYQLPSQIAVHGMLTVNGEKMSKSRGTFILADKFAEAVEPEALRYYFACKLSDRVEDIDFHLEDFVARVNADLVNKIVNLLSRTVPLLHRGFQGIPGSLNQDFVAEVLPLVAGIENSYRARDTAQVVRTVVSIADRANRYLQDRSPWDTQKCGVQEAHEALTTALWAGKVCVGLLKPILPKLAQKTEAILGLEPFDFKNVCLPLALKPIGEYERLFERLDLKKVNAMIEEQAPKIPENTPIGIDDFMKIDLRVARVLKAKSVEGSDKLISVTLDVGPLGQRHVFSGLRPSVQPEDLIGQKVLLVANLAPRKMKFGLSEGMICAAGEGVPRLVLAPDAEPGDRVR
ncbi:MAG: methionine--tRNA ligase [Myxococcaceae bacterium]|nr:methionine--tRNA ligase [Myxococcaceae bacterium]MBH2006374.1 methionine--tRNA ligase [Myxococcaceae bacterium]